MPAAIKVVEFRFGDRIIDVDRRDKEPVFLMHFVKSMHPSGRFLGNTSPFLHNLVPAKRIFALNLQQQIFYHLLFPVGRFCFRPITAFLEFVSFVNEQGRVAAIIDNKLGPFAVRMRESAIGAPPIIFKRFPLPGENRDAGLCTVICNDPVTRTSASGLPGAYFSRIAIRPGISFSAMPISFLPKSARLISATL